MDYINNAFKRGFKIAIFLLLLGMNQISCYKETVLRVTADFATEYVDSNKTIPVQVRITNNSLQADTYEWTFEGGLPATSTKGEPGVITYETAGEYTIKLVASNQDGSEDTKTATIKIYDAINIDFTAQIINNEANYPPVQVQLINRTDGQGLTYQWIFEGGSPSSSTDKNPPNVVFTETGSHITTLTVNNGVKSASKTQTITVAPDISADFSWTVDLDDNDYQVPVTLQLVTNCISATTYQWTLHGGSPAFSTQENPSVIYSTEGTYLIQFKASNGSNTQTVEKQVTFYPNTNLRVFNDIKLGINSAHNNNTVGAFFSTSMQQTYTANQIMASTGKDVDIVFFGLNSSFSYNKFVSPDQAQNNGFMAIANAQHTVFVNSQETCGCGLNFTASDFDAMANDSPLKSLSITETPGGLQQFDNSQPRIVLFQTKDGKKGAIKIKEMVNDGVNSYIICDIKIQKSPDKAG